MDVQRAVQAIEGMEVLQVREEVPAGRRRWDALVRARVGRATVGLAIEGKASVDPRSLDRLAHELVTAAPHGWVPVVAAPYVGPALRRRLEQAGLGWLDSFGNVHVEHGDVLVHIERRVPRGAVPRPRGRLFGPANARLAQALLEAPGELHRLSPLAGAALVRSVSTVSRALAAFQREGLVERRPGGWAVPSPRALMDAWLDEMQRRWSPQVRGFFSPERPSEILVRVARLSAGRADAIALLTGASAGELVEPILPAERIDAYVFPPAKASLVGEALGGIPATEGANVRLLLSPNEAPKVGAAQEGPYRRVGRAQLILDMVREGGRSVQVADALRERWGL